MNSIRKSVIILGLLLMLTAVSTLLPAYVAAQDADLDGFLDQVETLGKNATAPGLFGTYPVTSWSIKADAQVFFPNYTLNPPDIVSSTAKDLFVILKKEPTTCGGSSPATRLPNPPPDNSQTTWLQFVPNWQTTPTFSLKPHLLSRDPCTDSSKVVQSFTYATGATPIPTFTQSAVRIYENASATSGALGSTLQGTPDDPADIIINTQIIDNEVTSRCVSGTSCYWKDPLTATAVNYSSNLAGLKAIYKKYVIAHEIGHKTLTRYDTDTTNEHHWPTSDKIIMTSPITISKSGTKYYFEVPNKHKNLNGVVDTPVLR